MVKPDISDAVRVTHFCSTSLFHISYLYFCKMFMILLRIMDKTNFAQCLLQNSFREGKEEEIRDQCLLVVVNKFKTPNFEILRIKIII